MLDLSPDNKNQFLQRFKILRSDYETRKSTVNKIEEKYTSQVNARKLMSNEKINNKANVERDMILDLHQKTDYQQDLLNGITKDLVDTHNNLGTVVKEVKSQEEQIHRIKGNIQDTAVSVKKADRNITVMTRRTFCQKVLLHILVVLLFIAIGVVLILKLVK